MTHMVSVTIDTGALRHNLEVIRRLAPKSRVMAVLKANAYGHGIISAARALDAADAFAVARLDEGLALRAAGIKISKLHLSSALKTKATWAGLISPIFVNMASNTSRATIGLIAILTPSFAG